MMLVSNNFNQSLTGTKHLMESTLRDMKSNFPKEVKLTTREEKAQLWSLLQKVDTTFQRFVDTYQVRPQELLDIRKEAKRWFFDHAPYIKLDKQIKKMKLIQGLHCPETRSYYELNPQFNTGEHKGMSLLKKINFDDFDTLINESRADFNSAAKQILEFDNPNKELNDKEKYLLISSFNAISAIIRHLSDKVDCYAQGSKERKKINDTVWHCYEHQQHLQNSILAYHQPKLVAELEKQNEALTEAENDPSVAPLYASNTNFKGSNHPNITSLRTLEY